MKNVLIVVLMAVLSWGCRPKINEEVQPDAATILAGKYHLVRIDYKSGGKPEAVSGYPDSLFIKKISPDSVEMIIEVSTVWNAYKAPQYYKVERRFDSDYEFLRGDVRVRTLVDGEIRINLADDSIIYHFGKVNR